ncbi:MAG: hypothetical protein AAB444_00260 [Patescibacteria group bacterium]
MSSKSSLCRLLVGKTTGDVSKLTQEVNGLTKDVNELKELSSHIIEHMATKEELATLQSETKADIAGLRTELKTDIFELRTDTEDGFSQLRTEMRLGFTEVKEEIAKLDKRTVEDTNALAHDVVKLKTQLSAA